MRDPKRIDRILSKLATYWKQYPDLRLSQIVTNFACKSVPFGSAPAVFHYEDNDLEKAIEKALGWEEKP